MIAGEIQPGCLITVVRVFSDWTSRHQDAGDAAPRLGCTGLPASGNGSEFVARQVKKWLLEHGIGTYYIEPGSPWKNPFIESFNSIFRTTFLNRWCFLTLAETKALIRQWLEKYNEVRPHGSLGGLSPLQFLRNFVATNRLSNK